MSSSLDNPTYDGKYVTREIYDLYYSDDPHYDIQYYCLYGNSDMVKYLYHKNENDDNTRDLISLACFHGYMHIIKFLETSSSLGEKLYSIAHLHHAIKGEQYEIIDFLWPKIEHKLKKHNPILMAMTMKHPQLEMIQYLQKKGVEIPKTISLSTEDMSSCLDVDVIIVLIKQNTK